jgi:hypothetical protein
MKKAVSFTLDSQNVVWLKGQAAGRERTVSAIVDQLVTDARAGGRRDPSTVRSVRGTIDLPDNDPDLETADAYVRDLFERSSRQTIAVKEDRKRSRTKPRRNG